MGLAITIAALLGALTIVTVPDTRTEKQKIEAEQGAPHSVEQIEDIEAIVYFRGDCEKRFYLRADGSSAGKAEIGRCNQGVN